MIKQLKFGTGKYIIKLLMVIPKLYILSVFRQMVILLLVGVEIIVLKYGTV